MPTARAAGQGLRGPGAPPPTALVRASLAVTNSFFFFAKASVSDYMSISVQTVRSGG